MDARTELKAELEAAQQFLTRLEELKKEKANHAKYFAHNPTETFTAVTQHLNRAKELQSTLKITKTRSTAKLASPEEIKKLEKKSTEVKNHFDEAFGTLSDTEMTTLTSLDAEQELRRAAPQLVSSPEMKPAKPDPKYHRLTSNSSYKQLISLIVTPRKDKKEQNAAATELKVFLQDPNNLPFLKVYSKNSLGKEFIPDSPDVKKLSKKEKQVLHCNVPPIMLAAMNSKNLALNLTLLNTRAFDLAKPLDCPEHPFHGKHVAEVAELCGNEIFIKSLAAFSSNQMKNKKRKHEESKSGEPKAKQQKLSDGERIFLRATRWRTAKVAENKTDAVASTSLKPA